MTSPVDAPTPTAADALAGQRVVIIGGSSGLGLASAQAAAAAGAEVVIAARSPQRLEAARETIPGAESRRVDVSDEESIRAFAADLGSFDHMMISSAGGVPGNFRAGLDGTATIAAGEVADGDLEAARNFMDVKFWSNYLLAYYSLDQIGAEGSYLFMSGTLARRPLGRPIATAVQAGVEALTRALALELAPIRVNALCPGTTDTPLWDYMSEAERAEHYERFVAMAPLRRVAQPEEIAHSAIYLMTNRFTTGTVLDVDGGRLL